MKSMIAETERLILRRYRNSDLDDLYNYLSDPLVVEYEPYKAMTMSEVKDNLEWRISTEEMIAVELKSNHKKLCNINIKQMVYVLWKLVLILMIILLQIYLFMADAMEI